jgi:hypothetical protein
MANRATYCSHAFPYATLPSYGGFGFLYKYYFLYKKAIRLDEGLAAVLPFESMGEGAWARLD